jgi:hypothetical protein
VFVNLECYDGQVLSLLLTRGFESGSIQLRVSNANGSCTWQFLRASAEVYSSLILRCTLCNFSFLQLLFPSCSLLSSTHI